MTLIEPANPPVAKRIDSTSSVHGVLRTDPYAWLRAENWQEAVKEPSTLPTPIAEYLQAENDYCEKATAHLEPLRKELVAEMRGRMAEKVESLPKPDGPYKYQVKMLEKAEYPTMIRTDLNGESEEVIFDVNVEASGHAYFDFGGAHHSPDHSMLFWSSDTKGSEFFTLYIRDIASGKDKNYSINNVDGVVWADNQTIFYTKVNSSHRIKQVYKHTLDTNPSTDQLIFTEEDERFDCGIGKTASREYIYIHTSMDDQSETWTIPVNDVNAAPTLFQKRTEGVEYGIEHQGSQFLIITNAQDATDWKIAQTPVNATSMENWTDVVPHEAGRMIDSWDVLEDWLIWEEVVDALPQVAYMNKNGDIKHIKFDEEAYTTGIRHLEFKSQTFILYYSSPTTPWETYEFNLETEERKLLKTQEIPSGHNAKDYITRRFSVESHDGAQVPVTLLYKHDTPIDGTAPALMYGYGSYGSTIWAGFDADLLSLADRGFVYAIAHVRGGEERGCDWYEAAKLERKVNSFHDFNAVGAALIDKGYCAKNKLISQGRSAGGLLVAASMNMQPDLYAGVIANVPFVDVLNTMLDETLPGTPGEWSMWGNPATTKQEFDTIKNYCPYDNTKAVAYPALYVTAGVSDPRVTYWEPAKWVAKIRSLKTNNNIVLCKTNMQSGHFGKTGRYAGLEDTANDFAFAISVTSE